MLPSPPPWKRRKAVKTYGRPSRSKLDSFKVFQDVVGEEGAEKKGRKQSGYGRSPQAATLDSPPTEQQAFISTSPDADNPFTDPASPTTHRLKPPPIHPRGSRALAEKSTNHPVLTRSATSTGVTYTPRLTLDMKPPPRPRKCRNAEPTLEDQDYPTILSPSKARNPDSKNYFRMYPGVPKNGLDRPYNEPPALLGITSAEMSDNVSTVSGTWARERAKDIFSGTKKAAEKIFGVAPSNARYKSLQQKGQRHKLKDMIKTGVKRDLDQVAANRKPEETRGEKMRYRVTCKSVVPDMNEDIVSLQDFLQDPFSHPEDYENYHNMNIGEEENDPFGSYKAAGPSHQRILRRSESTQDLLKLGSMKMKMKNFEKEEPYDSKYCIEDGDLNSFFTTTNLSPGSVYDRLHSQSDNEMPSSSPMFQSTPKKGWDHPKVNFNLIGFDTDSTEDMTMGELLDNGSGGVYDESNRDGEGDEFSAENLTSETWNCQEEIKMTTEFRKNRHLVLRAIGSEDELCDALYDIESSKTRNKKGYVEMSIDRGSDNKEDKKVAFFARTNDRNLKERANQKQKNNRESINAGGSRTSKHAPKDRNHTKTMAKEGAVGCRGGSNQTAVPRTAPKKSSSGGVSRGTVKKGVRKRMYSRGYEQIEIDDEVDELQMDLPAMMI